jgi:hypothetical protein
LAKNAQDFGSRLPIAALSAAHSHLLGSLKVPAFNEGQSEISDWPFPFAQKSHLLEIWIFIVPGSKNVKIPTSRKRSETWGTRLRLG